MELLDVTSALTRELELLLASKASEPSFHVLHHNVNSQVTLITAHVAASITSCIRGFFISFVHLWEKH